VNPEERNSRKYDPERREIQKRRPNENEQRNECREAKREREV